VSFRASEQCITVAFTKEALSAPLSRALACPAAPHWYLTANRARPAVPYHRPSLRGARKRRRRASHCVHPRAAQQHPLAATPPRRPAAAMTATAAEKPAAPPRKTNRAYPAGANMLGMMRSCAANVDPRLAPAMPTLAEIRASPHYPCVVTPDPSQSGNAAYCGSSDLTQPLPINGEAIEWENDMWKVRGRVQWGGRVAGWLAGL
jgi:hypothetical protein